MYALIFAVLLASDVPLVWVVRHPLAISAAARDVRELAAAGAAWPGKFTRGLAYHRHRFEHEKCHARTRETTTHARWAALAALIRARTA
jgi:hypothetical protein